MRVRSLHMCQEVWSSKGPAGTKPCLSCLNVVQHIDVVAHPGLCDLAAMPRDIVPASDADVFKMADMVAAASAGPKARLAELEQRLGINHDPEGIMFCDDLRPLLKPVSGWFRDFMHVLCVGGVANIEVQQVVKALQSEGVAPTLITEYFEAFTLPKAMGKANSDWFTVKRLGRPAENQDAWRGFASELLVIIPILCCFLVEAIAPSGRMQRHVACFRLLDRMVKIMTLGADTAAQHAHLMRDVIKDHGALYIELYRDHIKPKFYHLFHLPDHAMNLGKLLSCWTTERKHRACKAIAAHVYNQYEVTLTREVFNEQVHNFQSDELFLQQHLISPQPLRGTGHDNDFKTALSASLLCGTVRKGDVVLLVDGNACVVQLFLASTCDSSIWCVADRWRRIAQYDFHSTPTVTSIVRSTDIVECAIWSVKGGCVRVLPPRLSAVS